MRKLSTLIGIIMVVGMLACLATNAFAWPAGGAGAQGLPTWGQFGGQALFSTDFAPATVTVIDMKTKNGYTNVEVDTLTKYQILVQQTGGSTAVSCNFVFGGYSGGHGTAAVGAFGGSSLGPYHPGNGLKYVAVYGCASSAYATRPRVVVIQQK